jgi:putative ABC transport system substrate-binding protein
LVSLKVDLIVTATPAPTRAAKNATTTIPIVMVAASNAVETGLVASLARPGGNVTGISTQYSELNAKLLELLHETCRR